MGPSHLGLMTLSLGPSETMGQLENDIKVIKFYAMGSWWEIKFFYCSP